MNSEDKLFGCYSKQKLLGSGSYGQVWSCIDSRGRPCAVKTMHIGDFSSTQTCGPEYGLPQYVLREIKALRSISSHINVIPLVNHVMDPQRGCVGLVFPHIQDGDLYAFLQAYRRAKIRLPLDSIKSIAVQLLHGIAHIHSHRVIHRDLKPSNVLVDFSSGIAKIIDFGLCRILDEQREKLSMEAFTRMYRPPEVLLGDSNYLCEAVDIWSVGAIVAELFILHPIFRSISPELMTFRNEVKEDESDFGQVRIPCFRRFAFGSDSSSLPPPRQLMNIFNCFGTPNEAAHPQFASLPNMSPFMPKWKPPLPGDPRHLRSRLEMRGPVSDDAVDFIGRMLNMNPRMRPSARELLRHPFVAGTVITPLRTVAATRELADDGWASMLRPPVPPADFVMRSPAQPSASDEDDENQVAPTNLDGSTLLCTPGKPSVAVERRGRAGPLRV